jgi:hypothetical protein
LGRVGGESKLTRTAVQERERFLNAVRMKVIARGLAIHASQVDAPTSLGQAGDCQPSAVLISS